MTTMQPFVRTRRTTLAAHGRSARCAWPGLWHEPAVCWGSLALVALVTLVLVVARPVAAAEPSAQVRAALEVLAGGAAGTRAAPSVATPAAAPTATPVDASGEPRTVIEVAKGQTIESVLRAHFAKSPLKPEVVREALVKLNPGALSADGRQRLMVGAKLQLPTRDDLVRQAFGAAEAQNLAMAAQVARADQAAAQQGAAAAARRSWVRYP